MNKKQQTEYLALILLILVGWGTLGAIFFTKFNVKRLEKASEYLYEAKKTSNDNDKFLLYEKAAALNPDQESYLGAGIAALRLGDNRLAQKYLGRVKTATGYYELGNAYYALENYQAAVEAYQNAVLKEEISEAYLAQGRGYLKLGNVERARTALEKSVRLRTSAEADQLLTIIVKANAAVNRGNLVVHAYNELEKLGYPHAAQNALIKAGEEGVLTRDGLLSLANTQINSGDYEGAYQYLVKAKGIDAYYPQTYQQLVIVAEKLGKNDEAREYRQLLEQITL